MSNETSNLITINYNGKVTYINAFQTNKSISYNQIFSSMYKEQKEKVSLNNGFATFIQGLNANGDKILPPVHKCRSRSH